MSIVGDWKCLKHGWVHGVCHACSMESSSKYRELHHAVSNLIAVLNSENPAWRHQMTFDGTPFGLALLQLDAQL